MEMMYRSGDVNHRSPEQTMCSPHEGCVSGIVARFGALEQAHPGHSHMRAPGDGWCKARRAGKGWAQEMRRRAQCRRYPDV